MGKKGPARTLLFLLLLCGLGGSLGAQEPWVFLPATPLFEPLLGDLREPHTGLTAYGDRARFEGEVGSTFELVDHLPADGTRWGWGVFGDGFILLDEDGATFPMQAADWHVGTYVSEVTGRLSHRLAFEHRSAHLGDSLQGLRTPIFYSRESFQYTVAYRPVDWCRAYAKWGVWYNMYPAGAALFASAGMEFVTAPSNFLGTSIKGYASGDLQGVQETSAFNKTFQLGIQWKFKEEESRDMRLALLYYDGLSQYGQFRQDVDEHWGLGLFFDP